MASDVDSNGEPPAADASREELLARLDVLSEENQRLREEYARARRTQYRRTAFALVAVGVLSTLGGVLFPAARTVLFIVGSIGIFGGILTYYLTPERFVPASVGERIYSTLADNEADVIEELGLGDERIYVPTDDADRLTRLFVPPAGFEVSELPDGEALASTFVVGPDGQRGVAFTPTGAALVDELERSLAGDFADDLETLGEQLGDGLVEQFELLDSATVETVDDDRLTVGVEGSAYGLVDRFDHPVVSLLAVGVVRGLETPVSTAVSRGDDRFDALVIVETLPSES